MTSVVELSPRSEETDGRAIGQADFHRYERYLGEILSALGMDLATPEPATLLPGCCRPSSMQPRGTTATRNSARPSRVSARSA